METGKNFDKSQFRGMFSKFVRTEQDWRIVEIMHDNGMCKADIFQYFSDGKGVGKPHLSQYHDEDDGQLIHS
jgi:hypothetical protein